ARRVERERIVHLHAAAALGLGELDVLDHLGDAARDLAVDAVAGRRRDRAVGRDEELGLHRARQGRLGEQLLLVAVLDLLKVAVDVAADDRLVEIARGRRLTDRHRRHRGRASAHPAAAAAHAVALAGARAVTDRAVAAGADGVPSGAT